MNVNMQLDIRHTVDLLSYSMEPLIVSSIYQQQTLGKETPYMVEQIVPLGLGDAN